MSNELPTAVVHAVLDRMPVARLAVTDHNNRADAMPIVFARVGETLFSPIDGKPKKHPGLARLAHIQRTPAVTLVLDHYATDWRELWWMRIEGDAQIDTGTHADWDDAVRCLRTKYPQYSSTPLFMGKPTMVVIPSSALRWWSASGIAGIEAWLEMKSG